MRTNQPKLVRILPLKSRVTKWARSTAYYQLATAFQELRDLAAQLLR